MFHHQRSALRCCNSCADCTAKLGYGINMYDEETQVLYTAPTRTAGIVITKANNMQLGVCPLSVPKNKKQKTKKKDRTLEQVLA